jgi:hypothetical protein
MVWILEGRRKERPHLPIACGPVASASNTGRWAMPNTGPPPVDCPTVFACFSIESLKWLENIFEMVPRRGYFRKILIGHLFPNEKNKIII